MQTPDKKQPFLSRLKGKIHKSPFIFRASRYVFIRLRLAWLFVKWLKYKASFKLNRNGLNTTEQRPKKIIASLTSYPARIGIVPYVIGSLLNQTMKPDKIILWLGEDKFPEKKLPDIFDEVRECGVDVEFRKDIGPHTKYFYALKEYPEDIVITFDDDWIYDADVIEGLYMSYSRNPGCVSAMRVEEAKFLDDGKLADYNDFDTLGGIPGHASHCYFASGVSGVLYPPHSLHTEAFNLEAMMRLCPKADDIWLRFMEMLNGTRTVLVAHKSALNIGVPGFMVYNSQLTSLAEANVFGGANDRQMRAVLDAYNTWPEGKTLLEIMREDADSVE